MKHIFLVFACFSGLMVFGQPVLPPEVMANIEQRIEAGMNPSVAIGIYDHGETRYFCFGKTRTGGSAVDEHTIYEIGSVSKTFTATLLADAALKGRVSIDSPAQKYLPRSVRLPTYEGRQITLGELSDHTSSLPRMPDNFNPADPANPYADYTVEQMYAFLSGLELTRPIGSEFEYSNLAQGLLGHILALQADTDYETLLMLTLTSPLGMEETAITFTDKMKKHLASPHTQGVESSNWDILTLAGAGGIRSSVHDMMLYLKAHLGDIQTPLHAAMELTHQPRHDKAASGIGLAWILDEVSDGVVLSHGGQTGGYNAYAGFNKTADRAVVVLTNSDQATDDIGAYLMGQTTVMKSIKPHVAAELRKHLQAHGTEGLIAYYETLKKTSPDKYDFGETEINSLGYYYLSQKDFSAALEIFKINTIAYPESFNVWDSYAEALMHSGDTAAAIANYRKSLELNPGNMNGVEMLRQMGVAWEVPEVTVDQEMLNRYAGVYQIAPGFTITVTTSDGHIYGQGTGQPEFEMFPSSEIEFYLKVVDARVRFNKNSAGEVESMTLFQNGMEMPGEKVK